jgi:hypothetical protein
MSELKAVAYLSRANKLFTQAEIDHLLSRARTFNEIHHVTGVLLHNHYFFYQYIEGESNAIDEVYERIKANKDHEILFEIFHGVVDELNFKEWYMGFCYAPEGVLQELAQGQWLSSSFATHEKENDSHGIAMLKKFWNNLQANQINQHSR